MAVTSTVMSIMLATLFVAIGAEKLLRHPRALANAEHLGYAPQAYQVIGALEVAGAAGLLIGLFWPPLGIAAVVGLLALLVGAVVSLRRVGDGMKEMFPAIWVGVVTAATAVIAVGAM